MHVYIYIYTVAGCASPDAVASKSNTVVVIERPGRRGGSVDSECLVFSELCMQLASYY